jgi:hypothetical protein
VAILDDVKATLRVTHTDDDVMLARLITAASKECAQYIYGTVPDYEAVDAVDDPQTVEMLKQGIILIVQSDYEGDPVKRDEYLAVAKTLWNPYRTVWGL